MIGVHREEGLLDPTDDRLPRVYFAGPVDYVEHRSPGRHKTDNWRHRHFGHLAIEMFCPTCLNETSVGWRTIMKINKEALYTADLFVGYFPGDAATFGTPVEVYEWAMGNGTDGVLVHPAGKGVFVQMLEHDFGLVVVRDFDEARQWLQHQL